MAKIAIKVKDRILNSNVFLKRTYDDYLQYGRIEIEDRRETQGVVVGKIEENLIQEDIVIDYDDDIEKFKIVEILPKGFYYRFNMAQQRIYISFDKKAVKAHLFTNRESVVGVFKYLNCYDEQKDAIFNVTLKSPELTKKIISFKKQVVELRRTFNPGRYLTVEQSKESVRNYLIYLLENYDVEIVEKELNEYYENLKRYYNNSEIEMYAGLLREEMDGFDFSFKYKDNTYKVTVGNKKTESYFEDFGGFEEVFKKEVLGE